VSERQGSDASLQPMRWWDVEHVLVLERDLFGSSAWSAEMFWSELAHPQSRWYLVARTDGAGTGGGALVGYAGVKVTDREADIQTMAVASAAQGRGLGATLLTALLDRATEQGARRVTLEVRADNARAIALYLRHGFARIAVRRGYYEPEGADAWIMQR
jgi:[ribosomal protein S18]-alanine N-acetyltransferase